MKQVFSCGEVAKICGVAPRTAGKWIDKGLIKGYRIPGSNDRRVTREALLRFLREHGLPMKGLEEEALFKVLLVGVESLLASRLRELLPADRFLISEASSGFDAGVAARDLYPDAVLIDLCLGRGEGIGIVRSLRNLRQTGKLAVLALAGEDEADLATLINGGFTGAVRKPFDPATVAGLLSDMASNKLVV